MRNLRKLFVSTMIFSFVTSSSGAQENFRQQPHRPYLRQIMATALNPGSSIFEGTRGGAFQSTNQEISWNAISNGDTNIAKQSAPKNCGVDFDCFIRAVQKGEHASMMSTVTITLFGVKQTTTSYWEVKGFEAGKC